MTRSVSYERLYSLGNYKNVKISDYIMNIPEELILNKDFMDKLRLLQMYQVEKVYEEYVNLKQYHKGLSTEEVIEKLDELELETLRDLKEIFESEGE